MVLKPRFRGFICTTAHPNGCEKNVSDQIDYIKSNYKTKEGPKNVLVIGASTGYGLASRIAVAFGSGSKTLGVSFEKEPTEKKTATPGWYNTVAFEKLAHEEGLYAKSINGDAFSDEVKEEAIKIIKEDMGKIDLVVYSLASPKRVHPKTKEVMSSVLKPLQESYKNKTVDFHTSVISEIEIERANEEEKRQTIAVMGGEDWQLWIEALKEADLLSEGVKTVAYSYIGPELTHPVYRDGTIGQAKLHLEKTAKKLHDFLSTLNGQAYVSVNKALVTQASSAIPVVSLYISILFKIMKEKGIHEGCIEQVQRLFDDRLYSGNLQLDDEGRIRLDDWEMREDVQVEVEKVWEIVSTENIEEITDIKGMREEFFRLFGFCVEGIDYEKDVDIQLQIPSISQGL